MRKLIPLNRIISFVKLDGVPCGYLKRQGYIIISGYARLATEIIRGNDFSYIEEHGTPCNPTDLIDLESMLNPVEIFHPINVVGLAKRKISRPSCDRYNIVMERIAKYSPFEGMTLLDIGCRYGYWAFSFEAAGFAVTGIDKEGGTIRICEKLKGIFESDVLYRLFNIEDLIDDTSYNIVCAMNVLHYVFADMPDIERRAFSEKLLSLARTSLIVSYPYIPGKAGADPVIDFGWGANVERFGTPSHSYSIWEITK